ncbi:hypothetical protein ACN08Y_10010 [Rothia sp. P5764]|uniref:hypothetical protein n=1 Tax=Rothia sp. P5764 TaxID=3402654 RepID=UPI003AC667A7
MSAHTTKTATALIATGIVITGPLPTAASAEEVTFEPTTASKTASPLPGETATAEEKLLEPISTEEPVEDPIAPIEVTPIDPPTAPEPIPDPSDPADPSPAEPTDPSLPVVPIETENPAPSPTPVPVESVIPAPDPTTEPIESAAPVDTENPVEDSAAPIASDQLPAPIADAVAPPQIDQEQNIILTGTITNQTSDEATGASTIVTEQITPEGHQVTTEYVTDPAAGQTNVRQIITDGATGRQSISERTVPATTFKAGGAASITSAQQAEVLAENTSSTRVIAGWLISLLALVLGVGAFSQYRRTKKSL